MDEKIINKWKHQKIITDEQAKYMLADLKSTKKESKSNNTIGILSTIGSILVGIGAILFIASNWRHMTDMIKVLVMVLLTMLTYWVGYVFKYQKANLPKVGSSLIFLGSLLFGASIILISQIYNLNANSHLLVLIWLLGVLPLVYAFKEISITVLSTILFYVWLGLVFVNNNEWWFFGDLGRISIIIFILASILMFAIGNLHKLLEGYEKIGIVYKLASLKVFMLCLYLLTFEFFSQVRSDRIFELFQKAQSDYIVGIILLIIFAVIAIIFSAIYNKSRILSVVETTISLKVIGLITIFLLLPTKSFVYVIIFNLLFFALTLVYIFVGYKVEKISLVNIGMVWFTIFVITKYFDWFFGLFDRALSFIGAGLLLVFISIFLERKRREIKKSFSSKN